MPAAKPSQATINNAVRAIVAAGLTPGALVIEADGTVRIELLQTNHGLVSNDTPTDNGLKVCDTHHEESLPPKWGEKKDKP